MRHPPALERGFPPGGQASRTDRRAIPSGAQGRVPKIVSVSGNVVGCSCFRILLMRCGKRSADVHGRMPPPRAVVTRLVTRRAWPLAWPSPSGPVHRWIGQQIGIYGRSMARRDPDSDRRPACSACAAGQIYDRSARIRRAAVRVGICREPYLLNLCELHLARLQGVLPKGGVRIVKQYQSGGSEAESPVRQHH